jgi:opacity protein-like surface antigen
LGNGKLHANINAGAMVNVYSWQKGDVLDAAGNPVNITTGKNSASPYGFKTNIGIGFTGGISVYYKLTDKLHLLAEPYYRHNLSSMNKDNLTLKQKYNTAGIKLGIRLDLK